MVKSEWPNTIKIECPNTILWVPIDVKFWRNGKNCFCLRGTQINCFKRSLLFFYSTTEGHENVKLTQEDTQFERS